MSELKKIPDLKKAALTMLADRGWLCIPLGPDANGLPKRPLSTAGTSLEKSVDVVNSLPWDQAKGLGIVLGEKSNNLGVLDIDHTHMFSVVVAALGFSQAPRLVKTARNRGHWYFYTNKPSPSTIREVRWNGETVRIELKANGTQVAAPPTTNYKLLNSNNPQVFDDMDEAFDFFCDILADFAPKQFAMPQQQLGMGAGYPKPWADEVQANNRNQTSYIEAHKLREAGIPLEQALTLMQASYEQRYEKGGIDWYEIQSTIKSAYRKGMPRQKPDHFGGVEI